jgi:hypothetical protein
MDLDMAVAGFAEGGEREIAVRAFRLLKAKNVGGIFGKEATHQAEAQPHRVDIPCGDGKRHGISVSR